MTSAKKFTSLAERLAPVPELISTLEDFIILLTHPRTSLGSNDQFLRGFPNAAAVRHDQKYLHIVSRFWEKLSDSARQSWLESHKEEIEALQSR